MVVVIAVPLYFVLSGGQIAVMITDFLQGVFTNVVFIVIVVVLMLKVDWAHIFSAVSMAPPDASLVNPFRTGSTKDYNFWYFLIGMIGVIYGKLSWQGTQAYNASAKSAHEAKMGDVLMNWRNIPQWGLFLVFVPVVAYTFLHHPDFAGAAAGIKATIAGAGNAALQSQLTVPIVLSRLLPVGLMGAFAAVMLAASIACHETYLHSWGAIFIQDVLLPLRRKPYEPKAHIRMLKLSIVVVAVFVFFFSLLFQQSEYIFLFFAVTGAIFAGGSGAVIIGGLYWKRGTTAAAWSSMLTGMVTAVGGIVIRQINPNFPINGQMFWGLAMASSLVVYVVVSLLTSRGRTFDMDRMLHRGKHEIAGETKTIHARGIRARSRTAESDPLAEPGAPAAVDAVPVKGWKVLGMGREFTPVRQGHLHRHLCLDAGLVRRLRGRYRAQPDRDGGNRGLDGLLENLCPDLPGRLHRRHPVVRHGRLHQLEGHDPPAQDDVPRPYRFGLCRKAIGMTNHELGVQST